MLEVDGLELLFNQNEHILVKLYNYFGFVKKSLSLLVFSCIYIFFPTPNYVIGNILLRLILVVRLFFRVISFVKGF